MNQNLYKDCLIIVDSCCELPKDYKYHCKAVSVPFHLQIDNTEYIDDGSLTREDLLLEIHKSANAPKSACPSPIAFHEAFEKESDAKYIFIVTVSSKLSGSFNSAVLASEMIREAFPDKTIHVFDSLGASSTETNIVLKINDYLKSKEASEDYFDPYDLIKTIEEYIKSENTYFVLQNYENFIKSGRISKVKAIFASYLHIYPVMKGINGQIELASKENGLSKALIKLVDYMEEIKDDLPNRRLIISNCNAPTSVNLIRFMIEERNLNFKEIIVTKTGGLSTMYAMDDGIILSF